MIDKTTKSYLILSYVEQIFTSWEDSDFDYLCIETNKT